MWQTIMEMLYSSFDSIIDDLIGPLFASIGLNFIFYSVCFLIVTAIMRLIIMPLVGGRAGGSPVFGVANSIRRNKNQQKNDKGGKGK